MQIGSPKMASIAHDPSRVLGGAHVRVLLLWWHLDLEEICLHGYITCFFITAKLFFSPIELICYRFF